MGDIPIEDFRNAEKRIAPHRKALSENKVWKPRPRPTNGFMMSNVYFTIQFRLNRSLQ